MTARELRPPHRLAPPGRAFTRRERWTVAGSAFGLATLAAIGYRLGSAFELAVILIAWPIRPVPTLVAIVSYQLLPPLVGLDAERLILFAATVALVLLVALIEAIVGYATVRAAYRLVRGIRPLIQDRGDHD